MRLVVIAFLSSMAACASSSPPVAATTSASPSTSTPSSSPAPAAQAKSVTERCDGKGEWSIAARGSGLARFEGKRVWLSAVERDRGTETDPGIVVLLEGRITNGAFTFTCAKSLHTSMAYPTAAVIIDDDGDGRCSAADASMDAQRYGWNADVEVIVEDAHLRAVREAHTVVGDRKTFDFCALYFPR